jgi:hypothetical protein
MLIFGTHLYKEPPSVPTTNDFEEAAVVENAIEEPMEIFGINLKVIITSHHVFFLSIQSIQSITIDRGG